MYRTSAKKYLLCTAQLCLMLMSAPSLAADSKTPSLETSLSINTPILELLKNPQARRVVEKQLPNLLKALEEDYDIADYLGASSLRELSIDDNHVIGFDDDMLASMRKELAALREE